MWKKEIINLHRRILLIDIIKTVSKKNTNTNIQPMNECIQCMFSYEFYSFL